MKEYLRYIFELLRRLRKSHLGNFRLGLLTVMNIVLAFMFAVVWIFSIVLNPRVLDKNPIR